jgi:ornithine cyclodeaminase/alanine dehydrogenase-like protein (mu-crystallin family)
MNTPPHLDAGRIYRLAPLDEVVFELRKTFADGQSGVPSVALSNGGLYVLLGHDGAVATLDGAALTARRTPAVSALATDALARPDVRRLAVFGTGVQAREHVRAMRWVRPSLEVIEIVGREPASTERFVAMLRGEGHPAVASSASEASSADLICTCTSSPAPVLIDGQVLPGAHINVVGSRCEVCDELIGRARVVDDLIALARGSLKRSTSEEITVFVSVGDAVEDRVVATLAARNAGLIA